MGTRVALKLQRLSRDVNRDYEKLIEGIASEEGLMVSKIALLPEYVQVQLDAASGEDRATLQAVAARLTTRMEDAIIPDPVPPSTPTMMFVNHGQTAVMGPHGTVTNTVFNQIAGDPRTTAQLLDEIDRLQSVVRKSDASDEDLEAAVQANVEAKSGRLEKALEFLAARAKTLLTLAETAGFKLLADYVRLRAGLPPLT